MGLGELIILVAGPLLFIDGFLPWYSFDFGTFLGESLGSISRSGWQSPGAILSMLAVLIGLGMAGVVAAVRFGNVQLPELPEGVTWGRLLLGLGAVPVVLVLIKLLNHSGDLSFGFYIGIVLVFALSVGGFLTFQEEQKDAGAGAGADRSM